MSYSQRRVETFAHKLLVVRSHSKWGREGRIDFPTRVNIKDAFRKLNGLKIDERTTLNLSHNPPGSSPPAESEPRLTILLVGNLPNYISETELEDRVWTFFERRAAITSVELGEYCHRRRPPE